MLGTNAAELLTEDVELDETYRRKRKQQARQVPKEYPNTDGPKWVNKKTHVLGALERKGEIRYLQVERALAKNMREFVSPTSSQGLFYILTNTVVIGHRTGSILWTA